MRNTVRYVKGVDKKVDSPGRAIEFLRPSFRRLDHEEVWTLFVDNNNNPIAKRLHTIGGFKITVLDKRRIVKDALTFNAAGVIVCHNHLSDVDPSYQDIEQTKELRKTLELFEVSLIDHIILNEIEFYSFSDENKYKLSDLHKS